ncbi:MAG TPA: hypothetical protein PKD79_03580, partial [Candidatus Doudnabacteria bacterium]|nr:hypothetical protein [Candidatus Doudnabacteria bacterium]
MATVANGSANGIAIGDSATADFGSSIVIGTSAINTATNQFVAGSSSYPINNIFFGKGVTNASPTAYTINGTGGSGTDIAGAAINIAGGRGTGTGVGGNIVFQYAPAGSSGSSLNALQTACSISGTNGSLSCPGAGSSSERFGAGSVAAGNNATALGSSSSASGEYSLAVGRESSTTDNYSVALGGLATSAGGISIGYAISSGNSTVAIGNGINASGIGDGIFIGKDITPQSGSIVLGGGSSPSGSNQLLLGGAYNPISNAYIGNGITNSSPQSVTINATGGSGTDIAGAALQLAGGIATGNAAGGSIVFRTSDAGSSGATPQSLTTKMTLTAAGRLGLGAATPDSLFNIKSGSDDVLRVGAGGDVPYISTSSSGSYALALYGPATHPISLRNTSSEYGVYMNAGRVLSESALSLFWGGMSRNSPANANAVYSNAGINLAFHPGGGISGDIVGGTPAMTITHTNNFVGIGTDSPDARLELAGNQTLAAWGVNGIQLQATAATYTDSSTAASGTATNAVFNSFAQPTLAATNSSVTTTNAATVYIQNAPAAGTNQTITNAYALWVDDGVVRFDGNIQTNITGSTQCLQANSSGVISGTGSACGSGGGGGALSDITAATGTNTINNANFAQTWNWNSLTTQTAMTLGSTSATSGRLLGFNHSTSTFTGDALFMNMANGGGSFTGNFADFQVNGTSRFKVGSGTVTTSGASAVAGVLQDLVMNNSTASGFQFGNRLLNTVSSGSAGTHVGQFIRMTDSTSLSSGQVVRGLEVQAYSGTNNNGINTGIATFGKTFGIHAETTAQAGGVSQPAAVFAYLNQVSGQEDVGNAIRAYSNTVENTDLVSIYQESSTFTGTGLIMNFGNNSGSFSGNFADFQVAGTSKFSVSSAGIVNLNLNATATTNGLCHSGTDVDTATDTNRNVVACSAAPGDIAEWYETKPGVTAGDIVSVTDENFVYTEKNFNAFTGEETGTTSIHTISVLKKSTQSYDNQMIGIVSTSPYQTFGKAVKDGGAQNPQPVALKGRVLVKVTTENGTILAGDYITTSGTQPGKGMRATSPGMVVGQALSGDNGSGMVMVFVQPFYFDPGLKIDNNGNVVLQRGAATTSIIANTQADAA